MAALGLSNPNAAAVANSVSLCASIMASPGFESIEGVRSGARQLVLQGGAKWPQLGAAPLFVRHFYEDLYGGPLGSLDPHGTQRYRKFTIIGNAGSES